MAVTQAQFESAFADRLEESGFEGLTKADVKAILDTLGETIHDALQAQMPRARRGRRAPASSNGNAGVVVRGVGRFTIRDRPARMGRNPATGEAIKIAASKRMTVKAHKPMRDSLGVK